MEIVVIGSGGALYSTSHLQSGSCFLLIADWRGKKIKILFDIGEGTLRNAIAMGIDITGITVVFISHRHMDHCGGLPFFVHYRHLLAGKNEIVLETLHVYGPVGLKRVFEGSLGLLGDSDFEPDIRFHEGPRETEMAKIVEVHHCEDVQSLAFIYSGGPIQVIYTGDLNDDPENDRILRDVAVRPVIITDAAENGNICHRGVFGAAMLGLTCGAQKVVLGHVRLGHIEEVDELCRFSGGRCVRAIDGQTIEI